MPGAHYFTSEPAAPLRRREIEVMLAGRSRSVVTASGVFSPDRIDLGTAVLLREVPDPPASGDLLDLGCGWGPLALTLALRSPHARVWGVDVNRRALGLLAENATRLGLPTVRAVIPEDVPATETFAAIWSNPPVRIGKPALHDLLRAWLPRLEPGGTAYLVVQRNLGADSLHTWLVGAFGEREVTRRASAKGFRVLAVHRPADDVRPPA